MRPYQRMKIRRFDTFEEAVRFVSEQPEFFVDRVRIYHYIERDEFDRICLEKWDVYVDFRRRHGR